MKLNIAQPSNGTVKQFDIPEEVIRRGNLYDHRLGQEVDGALFGENFAGYTFKLTGGNDKEGFPMVQGVMANARVSLLLKRGAIGYRAFRGKSGERQRKSVRGCIIASDIAQLNVVISKAGPKAIEGVTDVQLPTRLGPKRASKIRKLFLLPRGEDVRKFLVKRKVEKTGKKTRVKCAHVQRLVTSLVKARRIAKVKATRENLQKSAQQRREWLSLVGTQRRAARQQRQAIATRRHSAQVKADVAAMSATGAKKTTKK